MKTKLSIPDQHKKRIALQTLKMTDAGAQIMGGMTKDDSRSRGSKYEGETFEDETRLDR